MSRFIPAILLLSFTTVISASDAPTTEPAWHAEPMAGRAAIRIGHYADASQPLHSAVQDAAPDSLDAAEAMNELGKLDRLIADYPAADQLDHQALALRIKLLGENDPLVATTLENLGELDVIGGKYDAAEKELSQALSIRTQSFGEQNADTAETMSNLGYLDLCLCRFDDADKLCRRAVEIQDAVLPADDPARAMGWDNLGNAQQLRSNLVEAEKLYKRGLNLRVAVLGDDHPDVGASYDNLGGLYADWGDPVLARRYLKLAVFTRQNALGENHPDTAESTAMLAQEEMANPDQFPVEKIAATMEKCLAIEMKVLGPDNLTTQSIQATLGFVDSHLNRNDDAERLLTAALSEARKSVGPDHFQTIYSERALADFYTQTSTHTAEAEVLYKHAIAGCEKLFGLDDRETGQVLQAYADFLKTQNRPSEAAPLENRAKAIADADATRNPLERLQGSGL